MLEFNVMAQQCAPLVHPITIAAVVRAESTFNPFAIGVVGGHLERQPRNKVEAIVTAKALAAAGYNFSVGLGQINRYNLPRYGLDYQHAFEPCPNLNAASLILKECFERAKRTGLQNQRALQAAFSCYYSGNFSTGFRVRADGQSSYVRQVLSGAHLPATAQRRPPMPARPIVAAKVAKAPDLPVRVHRDTLLGDASIASMSRSANAVMVYR